MLKVRRQVAWLFPPWLLAPAQQQPAVAVAALVVESRLLAVAVVAAALPAAALAVFQCPKYLELFPLVQLWDLCCAVMQPWPDSSQ